MTGIRGLGFTGFSRRQEADARTLEVFSRRCALGLAGVMRALASWRRYPDRTLTVVHMQPWKAEGFPGHWLGGNAAAFRSRRLVLGNAPRPRFLAWLFW